MNNAAQKYLQTQVATTTPADILILLYDGAIKFLKRAKIKIQEGDVKEKGILIAKALDIINELQCSLNKDKGGALADNLNNLYFYCSAQLLTANLKLDTELVDRVIKILGELRSAFNEIKGTAPMPEAAHPARGMVSPGRGPAPGSFKTGLGQTGFGKPMAAPQSSPASPLQTAQPVQPRQPSQPSTAISQPAPVPPSAQQSAAGQPVPAAQAQGTEQRQDNPASSQPAEASQPVPPASVHNFRVKRGMAAYMKS
ncbi:MAG: flagellar export chaperone FliS [Desulfovibrio sp.]|uniref:flagellar export chaperone FliS n=1 Tax=Desulfovibrio sp. 7SRBS1 TaxID=3378064 RepID=UPI003B3D02DB